MGEKTFRKNSKRNSNKYVDFIFKRIMGREPRIVCSVPRGGSSSYKKGVKMRDVIIVMCAFLIVLAICTICCADDPPIAEPLGTVDKISETVSGLNLSLKQGFLMNWNDGDDVKLNNLSTFEVARTKPVESWGNWNALWEGWTLDAGFAYDAAAINTGALLIGREFGTLGKYLPIDFPLKDLLKITIYPIGVSATNLFHKPKWKACSGGAFVKFTIKT